MTRLTCLVCIVSLAACGARSVSGGGGSGNNTNNANNANNKNNKNNNTNNANNNTNNTSNTSNTSNTTNTNNVDVVTETVTCVFIGAWDLEEPPICRSSAGSCQMNDFDPDYGHDPTCEVKVSGPRGQKLDWSTNCSEHRNETVLDGTDERVSIMCVDRPVPPPPEIEEGVTCRFHNSNVLQECVSSEGFGCYGIKNCQVEVFGMLGSVLQWKSTCDGSAETIMDGNPETVHFKCNTTPDVTEQVTCVFSGSNVPQECYSANSTVQAGCTGVGDCTTTVFGPAGTQMTWKSSCGGYSYTQLDGNDEKVFFSCQ